jgi:formylglycine-generating enzyme required for sulfatase activity
MEEFSCGGQKHEVGIFRHEKSGLEFALVPGGTFDMGSPETEKGREVFENLHTVTLSKPYLVARTECTQSAWSRVIGTDPSKFKGAELPVETVSWEEATSFCEASGLSLPSEAQWERACRAGTSGRFYHGDDVETLDEYAWFAASPDELPGGARTGADGPQQTHPVGQKKPNAFGLFDMLGNVHEWCSDMMGPYPTAAAQDPFQPIDGTHVDPIFRGGCWRLRDVASRPAFRLSLSAKSRDATIGFRPAKTVSLE